MFYLISSSLTLALCIFFPFAAAPSLSFSISCFWGPLFSPQIKLERNHHSFSYKHGCASPQEGLKRLARMDHMDLEVQWEFQISYIAKKIRYLVKSCKWPGILNMGGEKKAWFFPPQDVFCNIIGLVCRMVTIFLPTQRTRSGGPFKHLEHFRKVHRKISTSLWKKF